MARTTSSSINIEVQMLELVRKEVDNDLKLEKKFRVLCLEVIDITETEEQEIGQLEKLSDDSMAAEELVRKEVDNDLKLEKKFRVLCLEVIDIHKQMEQEIGQLEKLSDDSMAAEG
nr:hypothetical protein [Tanacetum cinerariifolium]